MHRFTMKNLFAGLSLPGLTRVALFALPVLLAAGPAFALDFPTRKDGVWETTMTMNGGEPIVQKMCFTPEVEKKVQATVAEACSRYEVRREGASWIVDSTCTVLGKVTSGRVVTTGDFTSRIRAEVSSKDADGTKSTMTLDARWLRPCGPKEKPGAIVR
jgi:hypothetical protein